MKSVIAIDLGASSGRVIHGIYDCNKLNLNEFHRFENINVQCAESLCWDTDYLLSEIEQGIAKIINAGIRPDCMAIDSWGVDFVLTDEQGKKVGYTVTYRDTRTIGMMEEVIKQVGADYLYQHTGIQLLPFNTIYQLIALKKLQPEWLNQVKQLQFIPDYLGYCLTGVMNCEYTNATTSQMVNCQTGQWDKALLSKLSLPINWLLPITKPNKVIASYVVKNSKQQSDTFSIPLASIASHDTASAVLAVPKTQANVAYLSSGTWSLMGIESDKAIVSDIAKNFNMTNEGGAEGKFRVLKNIMGLWLIQGIQKELVQYSFSELVTLAQQATPFRSLINPDHVSFLNPTSMVAAIQQFCEQQQQPIPRSPGELTRCAMESLALQYRSVWEALNLLSDQPLAGIHIVGGGCQNQFLNQLCADACCCDVWAGPIEASAIGNICGQLIAIGEIENVLEARQVINHSFDIVTYKPNSSNSFDEHSVRYLKLCDAL